MRTCTLALILAASAVLTAPAADPSPERPGASATKPAKPESFVVKSIESASRALVVADKAGVESTLLLTDACIVTIHGAVLGLAELKTDQKVLIVRDADGRVTAITAGKPPKKR